MNKKTKNILVAIFVTILIALLGVAAYFIALRMQTEEVVAPTAPESKPSAAETWVGSDDCDTSFVIAQITLTPTATPTDGPTATPTSIVNTTPTATPAAGLPDAGILSLSGVIAFGGGLLMAILGIILAL